MAAYEDMIAIRRPRIALVCRPCGQQVVTRVVVAEVIVDTLEKMKVDYPKLDAAHAKELKEARKRLEGERG